MLTACHDATVRVGLGIARGVIYKQGRHGQLNARQSHCAKDTRAKTSDEKCMCSVTLFTFR